MTTDTRPSTAEVWDWLAHVPDPEIPVISLTDLGIIRDVAWDDETLVVTVTPTYSGCPATAIINLDIEKALRERGVAQAASSSASSRRAWTTDWISDEGRDKLRAYGIAPPIDGTAADGRLIGRVNRMAGGNLAVACPRCGSTHTSQGQPVRLDAVQGQLPLRRLPGTLRLLQVHLSGHRRHDMARFHTLDVVDVRRETRDAVVVTLKPQRRGRRALRLHPRPVPDLPPQVRRRRAAPQLLDLRRPRRGPPPGRHQARRRRRLLHLGQRGAEGRRHARGHAADGPLLHRRSSPTRRRTTSASPAAPASRRCSRSSRPCSPPSRARPSPSSTPTGRSARSCSARSSRT